MKTKYTMIKFVSVCMLFSLVWACSDSGAGPEAPAVDETVVVGTRVKPDFLQTGKFDLLAVPVSESGASILSDAVKAEIKLNSVSLDASSKRSRIKSKILNKTGSMDIAASIISRGVNKPGTHPIAVSIDIDGSGSMRGNDPNRLRVSGAKDFIDKFSQSKLSNGYAISIFTYEGNPNKPFLNSSELLSVFSNDITALKTAVEGVEQSGGTPTYSSLLDVLYYSEDKKPHSSYERSIVLLSDGQPNSIALRDSVCQVANNMESPIYAIGLGPASDLSMNPNPTAIAEMRFIASCTGGSYAGISPSNQTSTSKIYTNIAVATSKGNLGFKIQLSGVDFNKLKPGAILNFTLILSTPKGEASADFSFTVPI